MFDILRGIELCQDGKGVVSRHPVKPLKLRRSPPTFTVLEGLVPIDGLDRRRFGEVGNTPHVRIDGVLNRFPAPEVLESNVAFELGVSKTPGVGNIAFYMPAWYFDSAVKLTTQESHFTVHGRGEWRPWWGTGIV